MHKNSRLIEFRHEMYYPKCFENIAKECGINDYINVPLPGLLSERQEEDLMKKLVGRKGIWQLLPLKSNEYLRDILFR